MSALEMIQNPTIKKTVGAVAAAGVALGGLAVIAPDADAQAYGQTCDLVLNTDAPQGDPHWDFVGAETSMNNRVSVPVYVGPDAVAGGAVSTPFAPMSSASMVAAAPAGRVICVVGQHRAIINGGAGADTIYGGAGDETINGGAGDDVIFGNGGNDVLIGKAGHDSLNGGAGNDILFGHSGRNDAVSEGSAAQEGRDTLNGNEGDDLIRGDRGDDLINGNNGDDCLLGGKGNDEVYGWNGDDTIGGGVGHDYLAGNDNNDVILGGKGDDTIRGNDGLDQVWGDSDLFDVGIEMTVNKGSSLAFYGDQDWNTINGRLVSNDGNVANNPAGVPVVGSVANVFVSMGELAAAKAVYVDGWSTARPNPTGTTQVMTMIARLGVSMWVAPPAVSATLTITHTVATAATAQARGMTLAASGLAASQVFQAGVFTSLLGPPVFAVAQPRREQFGDPFATSGPILGPLAVPPDKYDTVNSSAIGGIQVPMATVGSEKIFSADVHIPKRQRRHWGAALDFPGSATMLTVAGPRIDFIATSDVAVTPVTMATRVLTMGAYGAMTPVVEPRDMKYFSSIGLSMAAVVNYNVVTSSGGTDWTFSLGPATFVSMYVHVKGVASDPTSAPPPVVGVSQQIVTMPRPAITAPLNHIRSVLDVIPDGIPHFRTGHLEVAACNIGAARMINDIEVPVTAFSGVQLRGLAGMHESMIAASARGDLEVALLDNRTAGNPGPSGAFIDWPSGVDIGAAGVGTYNDDIRGGDSDDQLRGEAGSDTIWGDHGDDTIWGEGDTAAYELAEAAFNVAPTVLSAGGAPTKAWSNTKRKLPAGTESQYVAAAGNDSLSGNIDDDSIEGGPGNDGLYGGPDDDHLIGDSGSDRLDGHEHWDACEPNGGFVDNCEIIL